MYASTTASVCFAVMTIVTALVPLPASERQHCPGLPILLWSLSQPQWPQALSPPFRPSIPSAPQCQVPKHPQGPHLLTRAVHLNAHGQTGLMQTSLILAPEAGTLRSMQCYVRLALCSVSSPRTSSAALRRSQTSPWKL